MQSLISSARVRQLLHTCPHQVGEPPLHIHAFDTSIRETKHPTEVEMCDLLHLESTEGCHSPTAQTRFDSGSVPGKWLNLIQI